jgi:hypothetical protein
VILFKSQPAEDRGVVCEKLTNHRLHLSITPLAKMPVTNLTGLVQQIHCRPVAVVPAVPDGVVVVHHHRVGDAVFLQEISDAFGIGLVREFRGRAASGLADVLIP